MKPLGIAVLVVALFFGGVLFFTRGNASQTLNVSSSSASNVSIVDGKQIIDIRVKGGYQPRVSVAKAGMPTVLRFNTNGTFDCSASVRIPSLGVNTFLPQTGATDIAIGTSAAGTLLGTCSMGMYRFEIDFKN